MTSGALTRELIADTSLWRLIVRVGESRLCAMLSGPESVERSVLFHCEPLADDSVKSLENAVYDNPLLLGDFASTDVIFTTGSVFAAPASASTLLEPMAEAMLPDFSAPRRVGSERLSGTGIDLVYASDADIYNFMARTFAAARFHHALALDGGYLFHRNAAAGSSAHIYALCEDDQRLFIIAFDSAGSPAHLSVKQVRSAADCAYYILATGLPGAISVGGAPDRRNEVCEILRRMRPDATVLPLTLSEDLLHLRHMAPEAAFDMIFLTEL